MTPLALIEALATLLWCYAVLGIGHWLIRTAQQDRRSHIPALVELLGHLVPAMIVLVLVVLAGAVIGLPSVVAFIAMLFPAGLAYGTHMALTEADPPPSRRENLIRAALTALVASLIIARRQLL